MADIVGTDGKDVLAGTVDADRISGGAGADRINGNAGNDQIYGGLGGDILTGDAGNDQIYGEDDNDGIYGGGGDDLIEGGTGDDILIGDGGNDTLNGGAGNDKLYGSAGNDLLNGGAGNDIVNAEAGDDVIIYRAGEGSDTISGGLGNDRVELHLSAADVTDAFRADIAAYETWSANQAALAGSAAALAAQASGATFTFASLGLTISVTEAVSVVVDGQAAPLASFLNQAPVAAAGASFSVAEDGVLEDRIVASDADGDALTYAVEAGPSSGVLTLDASTGAFVYQPGQNVSGADSFSVRVSDGKGASTVQTVSVGIAAVADAATLAVADASVLLASPTTGTAGNDILNGDSYAATATVALDIAAALTDVDGSESLTVRIAGVPATAVLSAGVRADDGSWVLTAGELAGLTLTGPTDANLSLSVTATAAEANGATATTSATLNVTFDRAGFADVMEGAAGDDRLSGGLGNDTLIGGSGNDTVLGGDGDDRLIAGAGNDSYDGGAGFDTIDFSAILNAVDVDLSKSKASGAGTDTVRNVEGVIGSNYNDKIVGSSVASLLDGGAGNDQVYGGAGNDTVSGGAGNDLVDGGSGNDVLSDGLGDDTVNGGSGDDLIIAGDGNDKYVGGSGYDTLDYSTATRAIKVDASKKSIVGYNNDTIDGIEKIIGTAFNDVFKGSKDGNVLDGGAGDDTFRGLGGADTFTGGDGADTFVWFLKDIVSGGKLLGADHITDFSADDILDVRELTKAFKGANIDSIVRFTDTADGAMMAVKIGSNFVDIALLEGVHGVTASGLQAEGMLLS